MKVLSCALTVGIAFGAVAWQLVEFFQERMGRRQLLLLVDPERLSPGKWRLFFHERVHRQDRINMFPDFLDLLGLGLSAGLTLERAWSMGLAKLPEGALKDDLLVYEQVLQWGRSRKEAFQKVSQRLHDSQLVMVMVLIEQAMNQGQALRDVVMSQARALRQSRWIQLERRAHTAGLRLLIPIFVFILPAVFLILFGPLFLSFSNGVNILF